MNTGKPSVREMQASDINLVADYWLQPDKQFMVSMGVDLEKIPTREALAGMLATQIQLDYPQKQSYGLIWQLDGHAVGHSNVNKIVFGEEAYMHLHLWNAGSRQKGMGLQFVKMGLPWFFEKLQLKTIFCEPYALNPAPNKTLEKAGFEFEKEYITIPGSLNFEQPVKRWKLTAKQFLET
jgi:RimJ/RimL family protein N-acetyltransferase